MPCKKQHKYLVEYATLTNAQDSINIALHICTVFANDEGYDYGRRIF